MAGLVDTVENAVLDYIFADGTWSYGRTIYVGLFTTNPTDSSAGTEVSGGNYARVTFPHGTAGGSAASGGVLSNNADITFATATASWGTIVGVGLFDAATSGNLIAYGSLSASKAVGTGDSFKIASGDLDISLD